MIGVVVIEHRHPRRRWRKWRRPDLRTIAMAVSMLQVATAMSIHAERDSCIPHALGAKVARHRAEAVVPRRLLADAAWMHRHVDAPGVRIQARFDDIVRES